MNGVTSMRVCAVVIVTFTLLYRVTEGYEAASTNYASAYLGAKIVEHSSAATGVHHLLKDDSGYMIIPCAAERKRFTIQLSREVGVRVITVTSLEFFSSIVQKFMVLGSNEFPCVPPGCMWSVLGRLHANFTRDTQRFDLAARGGQQTPSVRFLRFLWVSHFGHEKSCTMTTIQVFGQDRYELAASIPAPSDELELPAEDFLLDFPRGPTFPPSWWREPQNLNISTCPATRIVRDAELYFEQRHIDVDLTCTWNVTRPSVAGFADIISSRQLAALKHNITAIRNALAQAASTEQVAALREEKERLAKLTAIHADHLKALYDRIDKLDARLFQSVLVLGGLLTLVFVGLLAYAASWTRSTDAFRNREQQVESLPVEESDEALYAGSTSLSSFDELQ